MFRKIILPLGLIAVFGLTGLAALAQGQGPEVKYKKETRYDFDDDLVEGELLRPEGDFIGTRRGARHSTLIKVRENFIPEMLKSAEDI